MKYIRSDNGTNLVCAEKELGEVIFCEVEEIVNSRPISEMPDSPNDYG